MRVVVTGATGFIGRHVVDSLVAAGREVHAISRTPPADDRRAHWHCVDLLDHSRAAAAVRGVSATHLIHCAWYMEHGTYWSSAENLRWVAASAELTRAFVEAGGKRVVLAGTSAEYDWADGVCDEIETPARPATLYGVAKLALWDLVRAYALDAGVSAASGRIFHVYGPGESGGRLVASVINACIAGVPADCTIGTQVRDILHVSDVGAALTSLALSGVTGVVNIGGGEPLTLAEVATRAAAAAGRPDLLRLGAKPLSPDDPPLLIPTVTRLKREVGWRAQMPLDAGLEQYALELGSNAGPSAFARPVDSRKSRTASYPST